MRIRTTATLVSLLGSFAVGAGAQQQQLGTEWNRNVTEFRAQVGRRVLLICPPNGQPTSEVYGTDTYTDDSSVCAAAAHAGLITPVAGGPVTIVIGAGRSSYLASTRNGVTSKSFGHWSGSFSFDRGDVAGRVDWSTKATGLALAGRPLTVECPANGTIQTIYGTDQYTDDSSICTAAVHAGLITLAGGGQVAVERTPEQAAFPASARNGIASRTYGSWPNGFRFGGTSVASAPSVVEAPSVAPDVAAFPVPRDAATPRSTPGTPQLASERMSPPNDRPRAVAPSVNDPALSSPPTQLAVPSGSVVTVPTSPNPTVGTGQSASSASPSGSTAISSAPARSGGVATPRTSAREIGAASTDSPPTALSAPTGVVATSLPGGQVKLTWNPVPGATLYHILYRTVGATQWYSLTDRPGDIVITGVSSYQSKPDLVVLPAGTLEFSVYAGRDAQDYAGQRSTPVQMSVQRYDGRYRVTVNGFRVHRASVDFDQNSIVTIKAEHDGKGDEVYLVVDYQEWKSDNSPADVLRRARTLTHGDINHPDWQKAGADAYRWRAGSLSSLGGLATGDGFPNQQEPWKDVGGWSTSTFPLFVWEGYLKDGDNKVVITPYLIEDDRYPGYTYEWTEDGNRIGTGDWDPAAKKVLFSPVTLQLSFAEAERIASTKDPNSNVPAGIFVARYTSRRAKFPEFGSVPADADYSLYIQVKRLQ